MIFNNKKIRSLEEKVEELEIALEKVLKAIDSESFLKDFEKFQKFNQFKDNLPKVDVYIDLQRFKIEMEIYQHKLDKYSEFRNSMRERSLYHQKRLCESLIKKIDKLKLNPNKKPIKTWSRKSTIIPDFVGISFLIYNGKKFIPITVSEDMVGHKFGEFAPTRQFFGHTPADKKAKAEEDAAKTEVKK